MSCKYKFYNKEGLYFVNFATVYWLDVFTRDHYSWALMESLDFCRKNKRMEIYAWCIMPSHVHLIFELLVTSYKLAPNVIKLRIYIVDNQSIIFVFVLFFDYIYTVIKKNK